MAERKHYRLLNPDGTFNISRKGIRRKTARDLYHSLLRLRWGEFLVFLGSFYAFVNLVFALAYVACGPSALSGIQYEGFGSHLLQAFFFSVETFSTIGYGHIIPVGVAANLLVTLEAFCGMVGVAVSTGLVFARFARPTARVLFSRVALISPHEGVPSFIFRMANQRLNQIMEAKVTVTLAKDERTIEGEFYRNFYELRLERHVSQIFALSWTVVHPIDEKSPLHGMSAEALIESQAEIIVSLTGIDDTLSQTIHTRYSYTADEILWDKTFEDMLSRADNQRVIVDLNKIHSVC